MKKVININFHGSVIPIEETASDILQKYTQSLRQHFASEEGRDEIINDIEIRIAELFDERLKQGAPCITDEDMTHIIDSMGRPEDFDIDAQTGEDSNSYTSNKRLYRSENSKIIAGVCGGLGDYFNIDPVIIRIIAIIFFGVSWIPYIVLWIALPSSATQQIGSRRKRLFRNIDEKIIAGVCSGLGAYFGINSWIPRIIFIVPFLSFSFKWHNSIFFHFPSFVSLSFNSAFTIAYIILWILVPAAKTTADKLEMQGKPVDLNNIKETIQGDLEQLGDKAKEWSKGAGDTVKNKFYSQETDTPTTSAPPVPNANTTSQKSGLSDAIVTILKIFLYIIVGLILFTIVAGLFALGVSLLGLLPIKDFFLDGTKENILAWAAYILLIWLPIIGIIVKVFRALTHSHRNSKVLRSSFVSLWIIGILALLGLVIVYSHSFRYREKTPVANLPLVNPHAGKIILTNAPIDEEDVDLDFFWNNNLLSEDTLKLGNTRIKIEPSEDDSFHISAYTSSNGPSRFAASRYARDIPFGLYQVDSVVYLKKGIGITRENKFHNQQLVYIVKVPIGKRITVRDSFKNDWINITGWNIHVNENRTFADETDMDTDEEYVMTKDGLEPVNDQNNTIDDSDTDNDIDQIQEEITQDSLDLINSQKELEQQIKNQQNDIEQQRKDLQNDIKNKRENLIRQKELLREKMNRKSAYNENPDDNIDQEESEDQHKNVSLFRSAGFSLGALLLKKF